MNELYWPLHILSRCIHYKNLTGASQHVGLSQPQLSRIINKIEEELQLVLLDRSIKRKTAWTQEAFQLAEIYANSERKLHNSLQDLQKSTVPQQLHIGTLEGLNRLAQELSYRLFEKTNVNHIRLDILDQNKLEEKFLNGDVDLIFGFRYPSQQKLKHSLEVGYQAVEPFVDEGPMKVFSPYEYGIEKARDKKKIKKTLISNSLELRLAWLSRYGGSGYIPSEVRKRPRKKDEPVLLLANDTFSPQLWEHIESLSKNLQQK